MQLHSDFTKRAVVHGADIDWIASPMQGVDRRMLDRIGDEVARATTIVRYEPRSSFSPHTHTGGEEFIVLDGVFQDEHGDYPAGTYIRNPPTSQHTPRSDDGCTILVKLWQFDPDDRTHVVIDMDKMEALADPAKEGVSVSPLFQDHRETVRLEHWAAGQDVRLGHPQGAEYFVLEGGFDLEGESFKPHSWLRLPEGDEASVTAGEESAKVWIKTGHLPYALAPTQS